MITIARRLSMSIAFERQESELILALIPERIDIHEILEVLNRGDLVNGAQSFSA